MASVEAENPVTGQITCGSLLHQPQQIWDEDGESDEDRDNILLQLEQECLNVCRRKVDLVDIVMYVNPPGGSVTGIAIFDTMRHTSPDVSTVCVGLAASMGAFLLSAGTKGKRYSLPNSRIMIHQPLVEHRVAKSIINACICASEMMIMEHKRKP